MSILLSFVVLLCTYVVLAQSTENTGTFPIAGVGSEPFDIQSLKGQWVEIFTSKSIKEKYEKDCECPFVWFEKKCAMSDTLLSVKTSCTLPTGLKQEVTGKVRQPIMANGSGRLQIKMSPYEDEWTQFSNFVVIKTFGSDDTLLVGSDQDDMFWLYSRTAEVSDSVLAEATLELKNAGYQSDLVYYNKLVCISLGGPV